MSDFSSGAKVIREQADFLLQSLLEHNPDRIYFKDLESRFILANPAVAQVLKLKSPDKIVGKTDFDFFTEEHARATFADEQEIIRTGAPLVDKEEREIGLDGTISWAITSKGPLRDRNGAIIGTFGISRSTTQQKWAHQQITEQAAILDKARDAILYCDLDGTILLWNKGAERIYGWTSEEVVGRKVIDFIYTSPEVFQNIRETMLEKGELSNETEHLTKDERKLTVEVRRTLVRDNEGRPKSVLAIITDITEKKKLEAQFMRAQRMESIGTLASGIAHDLNNILAPIMLSIELLKKTAADSEAKNVLKTIEVSTKRGADIVRQVLSFARGIEGQKIEIQPKYLLKDLENIIRDTFPKDIRLQFTTTADTWTILCDPTQVEQILLNLCVNARDAMPYGGQLIIDVENCVIDEQYAAMNTQAKVGRYVNISVTDSGTGIPADIRDKIFEPFFTTKGPDKGTGLGLSTVMSIVKSHEGMINVYSEPGKGTTFKVYLPAMELAPEALKRQLRLSSPQRGHGETVLVVDDEVSILTITSQTLQAFGYRTLSAKDGSEAVAIYTKHRDEIDLVLTDMMMPLLDGTDTIHILKRVNPAIKILATSGLHANDPEASGNHVKHFLTKPYTAETLLKVMRTILDEE